MEVMGSPPNDYFDFNLPYLSAPSTPKRFGEIFMSAPTSPSTLSEFYSQFDYFSIPSPTSEAHHHGFTFFVEEDSNNSLSSAHEIFYGGKIKHFKEDNNLLPYTNNPLVSPKHHSISTTIIEQGHEDLSPIKKNESYKINNNIKVTRGRNKTPSFASSNSCRERVSRSLSPFREFQYTFAEESKQESSNKENVTKSSTSTTPLKSSRKWRLRDLLSFRGISEGNSISSNKDSLMKKYLIFFRKDKGSRCSSTENPTLSSKKKAISPHELHYTRKKAEAHDLKKKTFLPYKHAILGKYSGFTT